MALTCEQRRNILGARRERLLEIRSILQDRAAIVAKLTATIPAQLRQPPRHGAAQRAALGAGPDAFAAAGCASAVGGGAGQLVPTPAAAPPAAVLEPSVALRDAGRASEELQRNVRREQEALAKFCFLLYELVQPLQVPPIFCALLLTFQ